MTKPEAMAIIGFIKLLPVLDNGNIYYRYISNRQFDDYERLVLSLVEGENNAQANS